MASGITEEREEDARDDFVLERKRVDRPFVRHDDNRRSIQLQVVDTN